jgi:NodT family efflux transporter outer membrane factor (OMF) lipoprotein
MTRNRRTAALTSLAAILMTAGCMVGPKYRKPDVPVTPAFKEPLPEGWKQAEPNDGKISGKWWEAYDDPQLNALVEQVAISNQNVLAFEAQYREARAAVRVARSALFPSLSAGPTITQSMSSSRYTSGGSAGASGQRTLYSFPADLSWEADVWGGIRRGVNAASAQAQVTAADLANAKLSYQSELAQDYFLLHGADGDIDLFQRSVQLYRDYLKLTQDRFAAGIASDLDVAQAESQLESTESQLISLGVARAQYEHAIAVLTGRAPAAVNVGAMVLKSAPLKVPVTVPSVLLERRPDIAAQERLVAAANEQIGIAKAAFFPTISLSGSAGFQSSSITTWLGWPSRFFSIGPTLAETVFDAGKRRATLAEFQAAYDATVAAYRQAVLTSFQQVEDALAAERILQEQSVPVDQSVKSAQRALDLATAQYKAGTADYLTVITAQSTLLAAQRTQVDLLTNRLTASVQLVVSLGGGWDVSQLPTTHDVRTGSLK